MKKILVFLFLACGVAAFAQPTSTDVWINEFHYDGMTTFDQPDQNEFVEIIVRKTLFNNPTEFAKLKLVLYSSGALDQATLLSGRGLPYNESSLLFSLAETEFPLTGFQSCATTSNDYMVLSKLVGNLQDLPAAFALVYNNTTVVQLLSYEKLFKIAPVSAGGGAAAGLTTTVIRTASGDTAMETAQTQNNHSVALIGSGVSYNNFTWSDAITQMATPCAVNAGQMLSSSAPLPVRWLNFSATGSGANIYTSWQVAEDQNTVRYEVEIKGAGYNNFTRLATAAHNTTANGRYSQTLSDVGAGTYLVRIKAVEANGSVYYSAERQVRLGKGANGLMVYPNPVRSGKALLQFVAEENSTYTVQVVDATGRVVKQQSLGNFRSGAANTVSIDLAGVLPGVYSIKLKGASVEKNTRIVVAE